MIRTAMLPARGFMVLLSLAFVLHSCSQQPAETPTLSAELLKEQYKDTRRTDKRDEKGIKHATKWMNAMRVNPATGEVDMLDVLKARQQVLAMRTNSASKTGALNLEWESIGPDNVGGRSRGFYINPNNTQHLITGSVTGGLFVSRDGALNWTEHPSNDKFISTSISSIKRSQSGDIYVGTGETFVFTQQNTYGHIGGGVYKSTDGGETFDLLPFTTPGPNNINHPWAYVSEIATDPFDGNKVFAAARGGLFYTLDAGDTWQLVQGVTGADAGREARDVAVTSEGVYFAEINKKAYRSTDGLNFQLISGTNGFPSTNVLRIEFGVTPQDANYVYAAICNTNDGLRGIYRSVDAGINWEAYSQENSTVFNPLGQQGEYDLAFQVNPTNKDEVAIGGQLELWKGGKDLGWNMIAYWAPDVTTNPYYIHADMHGVHYDPTNSDIMYVISDGGVSKSTNANQQFPTFTTRNKNYVTTQFYHVASGRAGDVLGGTQDNGSIYINFKGNTVNTGDDVRGGDGGWAAVSQLEPNIMFAESQFGCLARSLNYGQSFGSIWDDFALQFRPCEPTGGFSNFIASYDLYEESTTQIDSIVFNLETFENDIISSTVNKGLLAFGANGRLLFTPDALETGGVYWYAINISGVISTVNATPEGDFYVGTNNGNLYFVTGFNNAVYNRETNTVTGVTATLVRNSWPGSGPGTSRYITSVGVDPNNSEHVLVTLGGYGLNINVFESFNAKSSTASFTSAQGDLPNMPVYAAIIDQYDPTNFILGTDFGIWSSNNNGINWSQEFESIYNTPIYGMEQNALYDSACAVIYAATYGRGIFRTTTLTRNNNPSCNLKVGINEAKPITLNKINLYPNPVRDQLYLDMYLAKSGNVTLRIIDIVGREIYSQNHGKHAAGDIKLTTDVSRLPAGVYVVAIETPLGLDTRQIVIRD